MASDFAVDCQIADGATFMALVARVAASSVHRQLLVPITYQIQKAALVPIYSPDRQSTGVCQLGIRLSTLATQYESAPGQMVDLVNDVAHTHAQRQSLRQMETPIMSNSRLYRLNELEVKDLIDAGMYHNPQGVSFGLNTLLSGSSFSATGQIDQTVYSISDRASHQLSADVQLSPTVRQVTSAVPVSTSGIEFSSEADNTFSFLLKEVVTSLSQHRLHPDLAPVDPVQEAIDEQTAHAQALAQSDRSTTQMGVTIDTSHGKTVKPVASSSAKDDTKTTSANPAAIDPENEIDIAAEIAKSRQRTSQADHENDEGISTQKVYINDELALGNVGSEPSPAPDDDDHEL